MPMLRSMFRLRALALGVSLAAGFALLGCSAPPRADAPSAQGAAPRAAAQAAANKKNAVDFYNQFFNQHDLSAAERYISPTTYIQHNPHVPNGRDAFVKTFEGIFQQNPQRQSTIKTAIAEGDLVALHVFSTNNPQDRGSAIVDIFRFDASGKIVEHWDVIQPVPEKTASGNGMF